MKPEQIRKWCLAYDVPGASCQYPDCDCQVEATMTDEREYIYALNLMKEENTLLKATIVRMKGEINQLHRALEEALGAPPWDSIQQAPRKEM